MVLRAHVVRASGWVAVLTFTLTACGAAKPVAGDQGFRLGSDDTRAYGAYRQTSSVVRETLRLEAGTRHVKVRMDCLGSGEITVGVFAGQASAPCTHDSHPLGFIGLSRDRAIPRSGTYALVVHASKDAVWSVAVDVGPGPVPLQDE